MKRYDKYKQTGSPWIGKIPSHWEKLRIKFLISNHADGVWGEEEKGNADDINCYRVADFDYDRMSINNNNPTVRNILKSQLNGRQIFNGDILLEKSGGGEATPVGRAVIANIAEPAVCSNFIHFLHIENLSTTKFLCYYFKHLYSNKVNLLFFNQTTGIQNLNIHAYLGQDLYLPPLAEQEAVAEYLDKKCGSIDAVISTQERRIALLEELKQSVITEAVTHGINPNATLRPSGIDWIGNIPQHWEKLRFKNFITLITTPSISEQKIGLENIESNSGNFIETDSEYEGNGFEFQVNDVVYGKLRPYLRKVWKATFSGNAVGDFYVFRCKSNSISSFLQYLLLSDGFTKIANSSTFGAKMPRVSSEFILSLHYFLPPLSEQQEIVAYIESKIKPIDASIAKAKREIELLKELKQSVITEAVTGKIKVY